MEEKMIFNIVAIIVGVLIFTFGIYYLIKEKQDKESRRIYGIASAAGFIITAAAIIKTIL